MFDKVYVISLRKDIERRDKTKRRLESIKMDFEFFDAYDGSLFNHIWDKLDNKYFTNPNYIACNLTHLAVYKDALNKGYSNILILEDDAVPHKNYNEMMDIIGPQIPEYDLLYLGWIPLSNDQMYWDYSLINNNFISQNIIISKNLWGLFAYSIKEELMKEMIEEYSSNFPMEIDRWFVNLTNKNCYGIRPQLFSHDYGISNNTGKIDESTFIKYIDTRIVTIEDYLI